MFRYLPEQASEHAPDMDWLHHWVTDLSVFFTVVIVGAMLYFAVRYRRRNGVDHETPRIEGSHLLELIWTVVPTIICIFIAYEGVRIFREMRTIPKDALTVYATGSQWKWDFKYASTGKTTINDFVLPVGKPVKVVLASQDVLHSFFIPAMRVKSDAVKGMYTYVSFKPVKTGEYHLFCTEYCGKDHSAMLGKLSVVSEAEFERWVNDKSEKQVAPVERGKQVYAKYGCKGCHSLDGNKLVGPSWLKLYGRKGKFADGSEYTADEAYLRESILKPAAHIVEGYSSGIQMQSFEGQLTTADIEGVIEFIKTLDGSAPVVTESAAAAPAQDLSKLTPAERGKLIYEKGKGAAAACSSCHSIDGSRLVGPSFKGVYGRSGKWADGASYTATDEYIHESIVEPNAHIVEGYAPGMLPYKGLLTDDDIKDITEYLKTVK